MAAASEKPTDDLAEISRLGWPTIGDPPRTTVDHAALPSLAPGRPDTVIDFTTVGELTVRAASVRGTSNRYYGEPRQDALCLAVTPDHRWIVVAVADGVSSARWSHSAADLAVRRAVPDILRSLASGPPSSIDWEEAFGRISGRLLQLAENRKTHDSREDSDSTAVLRGHVGAPPPADAEAADSTPPEAERDQRSLEPDEQARIDLAKEVATTLTLAVVPVGQESKTVHAASVGDSPIWLLRSGRWEPLDAVKNEGNDISSSATTALPFIGGTGPDRREFEVNRGEAILIMTDGVSDPMGDGTNEAAVALASALSRAPEPLGFAALVGFGKKSWDDDRTAVGIWMDGGTNRGTVPPDDSPSPPEPAGTAPVDATVPERPPGDGPAPPDAAADPPPLNEDVRRRPLGEREGEREAAPDQEALSSQPELTESDPQGEPRVEQAWDASPDDAEGSAP